MFDVKVQVLGGPEIAAKLNMVPGGLRDELRDELAMIGDEIVSRAQGNAPKRTGIMASRVAWYFGREYMRGRKGQRHMRVVESKNDPRIFFTVRPRGKVAHLVERGVSASFMQKVGRGKNPGKTYPRTLRIPPRPWFMPAVESVGGAAGVNARLQRRLDNFARRLAA